MNKFCKRVSKSVKIEGNALVIGDGFGFISDILSLFSTVFVTLYTNDQIKAKNLVYRESMDDIHILPELTVVFLDLQHKHRLNELENIMIKLKPIFLVEGNDPLEREWTKKFYQLGYRAVDQQGFFHQWKRTQ